MTLRFEIFPDDLDATADFYVRVLGFRLVRDERAADPGYLALERDGVYVGAAWRPSPPRAGRRPPTGVELVLEVDDLDAERVRVLGAGWPLEEDVAAQPWGLRDFRLLDPSGYYLRVTERAARTADPRSGRDDGDDELAAARRTIDGVDAELVHLLSRRAAAVREVLAYKQRVGLGVVDRRREAQMMRRIAGLSQEQGVSAELAQHVLRAIIDSFTVWEVEHLGDRPGPSSLRAPPERSRTEVPGL